jgi:predicted permease
MHGETMFNIVALIPGHYLLLLFARITGSRIDAKSDAAGELSITVGTVFWAVIFCVAYVAYHA